MELTATALLRANLEAISPKNEVEWRTQRALLDMAERQLEMADAIKKLGEDGRLLRTMVERVAHR
ncbi:MULTISPECIES: hypothetical protein [unclassified Herbaspirillum]|uniref:hypothetical protein n=1 Tax=unclassified Herbaspirillum TaxID=2624150 RepID=UPI000C09DB85|nr:MULTISPECIES: hypothetical protein [unclassified Herbaspirillum]MAF04933.1 hypothetical protein [Herbaspirillum sp.]MBO18481.1 hypothetical protein [Herbaspirillum sp.]|tara:strand:+ start:3775 stop:3969 length:195 start_codon:yes stop_codon:yes gene_type:complete